MKLDPNSNALTPGRWHFCQPGAKAVPYWSAFTSRNWDEVRGFVPNVGEVRRGGYSRGKPNPRLTGQTVCGGLEVWAGLPGADRTALPVDADGVPLCCAALPFLWWGAAAEGRAVQGPGPGPGRGGLLLGGSDARAIALSSNCAFCPSGSVALYRLTIAGVTNGDCADCGDLNGTWDIPALAGCFWPSASFTLCGALWHWALSAEGPCVLYLVPASGPGEVAAFNTVDIWDCLSEVSGRLDPPMSTQCDWSSSTVTIRPIPLLSHAGSGGLLVGGSAVSTVPLDQHHSGGLLVGGAVSGLGLVGPPRSGGLLLGGAVSGIGLVGPPRSGGLLLGGEAMEEFEMGLRKNVAGQTVYFFLVNVTGINVGTPATGLAATVQPWVAGDGGAQGGGAGSVTEDGNGQYHYSPTQAETNYDAVAFTFTVPTTNAAAVSREFFTTL